ncbi:hypothetical protein QJS04_geneDACA014068 [Acorus gramineus]|uniref:Uncharacterized protein n=1 Tax=Acorus gramineus TaxID=55184 RepID=A0AAV9B2G3_ACOGR|nr:hypothetical protein QJS04_geneDACA014068 [Acorus gramineus]
MDGVNAGMSWADQWDSSPDLPPEPLPDEVGKGGKEDAKNKSSKKAKSGAFGWMKELCQKKSKK